MKTQVELQSSKFPPYEGEEEQINPGLWGKRLAEYWVQKLSERGIQADEIIGEDWGWYVPIKNEGFRLAICCGHQNGDDDEFLCFTDPDTPIIKKLFKKIDVTAQLTRLTEAMQQILASDPEIRDVVWTEPR
jgi:trehalose-6-phosphatase